jgi:superfamily II DNA/RNA helicase
MLPKVRQNLFFSATMPKEISNLASGLLTNPVRVEVAPVATTVDRVNQSVIHVDQASKLKVLVDILKDNNMTRTLVFSRTKHGADKIMKGLSAAGYTASAIHGNKSQANREKALAGFKNGKILVLVATDIAARGIDVDGVSHVINYDLPHVPESYVHRIGRTARAGAEGVAIAFCAGDERSLLKDIERTIRQTIPVVQHCTGQIKPAARRTRSQASQWQAFTASRPEAPVESQLPKTAANQLETIVHIRLAVRAPTAATIHQSATMAASRPGCRKSAAQKATAVPSEWASNFHTLCVVVPGLDSRINPPRRLRACTYNWIIGSRADDGESGNTKKPTNNPAGFPLHHYKKLTASCAALSGDRGFPGPCAWTRRPPHRRNPLPHP